MNSIETEAVRQSGISQHLQQGQITTTYNIKEKVLYGMTTGMKMIVLFVCGNVF